MVILGKLGLALRSRAESFSSSSNIDSSSFNIFKDQNGKLLQDLINCFGEHYEAGHSLDQQYWQECLDPSSPNQE